MYLLTYVHLLNVNANLVNLLNVNLLYVNACGTNYSDKNVYVCQIFNVWTTVLKIADARPKKWVKGHIHETEVINIV